MGLGDLFKASENQRLSARVAELEAMITPEMLDLENLKKEIAAKREELASVITSKQDAVVEKEKCIHSLEAEISRLKKEETAARSALIETNDEVLVQTCGIYKPRYAFADSSMYKDRLAKIREAQKRMVKDGTAAIGTNSWTVNGDAKKGEKMVKDITKLLLRAFNSECDDVIEHVKFSNVDASEKRIRTASETISKLGSMMSISIQQAYIKLKIQELYLAYEFQVKKQEEKEELKQLRAEERERARVEKEIAEAKKKIEKEQKHYSNAYSKLMEQIATAAPDEKAELEAKRAELAEKLQDLDKSMEDVDYRQANQRAGYVYVISNIGAFGENVYKIGMTRRLDPMDRVDELGDASVPFDFDVHAMIFTEDAPALEAALHEAFKDRKLNMVNQRREFFNVTLEEVEAVVKANYDKTVEFTYVAQAQQYRESLLMKSKLKTV